MTRNTFGDSKLSTYSVTRTEVHLCLLQRNDTFDDTMCSSVSDDLLLFSSYDSRRSNLFYSIQYFWSFSTRLFLPVLVVFVSSTSKYLCVSIDDIHPFIVWQTRSNLRCRPLCRRFPSRNIPDGPSNLNLDSSPISFLEPVQRKIFRTEPKLYLLLMPFPI